MINYYFTRMQIVNQVEIYMNFTSPSSLSKSRQVHSYCREINVHNNLFYIAYLSVSDKYLVSLDLNSLLERLWIDYLLISGQDPSFAQSKMRD